MKRLALLSVLAALVLGASPAAAKPVLNLHVHHAQTNAIPGGSPGRSEVTTTTAGSVSADEVQEVNVMATIGQFRLGFGADTTPNLPYNASAAEVQSALGALPSIGPANISVKLSGLSFGYPPDLSRPPYVVTFSGAMGKTDVPLLTVVDGATPLGIGPELWFNVENVGDSATVGAMTLTVTLPPGLKRRLVRIAESNPPIQWSCPGSPGDAVITCTTTESIPRHLASNGLTIVLDVSPSLEVPSDRLVKVKLQGGGSPEAPPAAGCAAGLVACANHLIHLDSGPAGFGFLPETFTPDFLEADGVTPVRQAGSHPERLVVPFDFTTVEDPERNIPTEKTESETIRDLVVDLPPGFIGNPTAVGECSAAGFFLNDCPPSSQVGLEHIRTTKFGDWLRPVFNMSHPRGAVADLAFTVYGNPVHIVAGLDSANRYAIRSTVSNINETLPPFYQRLILWGVPADHSHDSERCEKGNNNTIFTDKECSTDIAVKPFLSVPSQCESDNTFRLHHYDSWQNTGIFGPEINYTLPSKFEGCEKPRFEPKVEIEPTGKQANTPTGLDVHIKIAQNENPVSLATPPVKRTTVTLPEGMSFSPSFADGLKSCTLAQMRLGTNDEVACPDASRIGEVELHSPLLPKSLEGSMYLAAQGDNPYGSTFALLLVLHDVEERGILVKVPGRIDVDQNSGQIETVFDDLPQFPFDDLTLKFRSGPRAPLVSPPSCGTQTIGIEVASYARPLEPVDSSNTYQVTEGPNGTPCPPDVAKRPFAPKFSAGTLNPIAAAYSPFVFELTREDDEQELSGVTTKLPPGLVAKIAGISFCPEAAIASISTSEFAGASEASNPACPASSQIGSITAGLGAGPGPNYFPGKVYLAGPYKGTPLSLAVVAPALAGPFDLGNVVVRAALRVDPETAQVTAISDPFPTILHGVILRTRDVRLRVDRPNTTINPTNCSRMSVDGEVGGIGGAIFNASYPFQAAECAGLAFTPKLDLRLFGGTKRGAHPKFRATLTMPPGGANIAAASVALPKSEFLDQGHIKTICTRVQFAQEACPAGSIYGTLTAKTPLLDETLTGNIYLRSSNNPLPDLVAAFRGGKIDANVIGRIDSINGGIRNTFDFVPDVPVSEAVFTFAGGKKGLLVNSRNICNGAFRATAKFTGQNGDQHNFKPRMQAKCGKSGRAKKRR